MTHNINKILLTIAIFISTWFILYPDYLPLVDLPQHAAQVATLDDLLKDKSPWKEMLFLNFDVPYLTTYLTWLGLHQIMPITWSAKVIVAITLFAYMFAIRLLRRQFNASYIVDWIALSCFFGFVFQFGFLTFLMSIPVGIIFFVYCKQWIETHQLKYLILLTFWGVFCYLSHILSLAFFCLMAYLYFLVSFKEHTWKQRALFTVPFMLFAVLMVRIVFFKEDPAYTLLLYDGYISVSFIQKTKELFYYPWNNAPLPMYFFIFLSLYLLPWFMGYRPSKQLKKYIPLFFALIVWYGLPYSYKQIFYIYSRFGLFVPIFFYLIWEKKEINRNFSLTILKLGVWTPIVFGICIVSTLFKAYSNIIHFQYSPHRQNFELIKQAIPEKQKVLFFYNAKILTDGGLTSIFEYLHYPLWYQAEKQGWVDYNFATAPAMIVRLKLHAIYPEYTGSNLFYQAPITCQYHDYFIFQASDQYIPKIPSWFIAQPSCENVVFKGRAGNWLLFEKKKP